MSLTLLIVAVALATPTDAGAPLAEAWLVVPEGRSAAEVESIGFSFAEGRRRWEDGRRAVRILVSERARRELRARGYEVHVVREDHRMGPPPEGYRTPEDAEALLASLAEASERAGLVRIGSSLEGRPLLALWLGQPPDAPGVPTWRVLGAHHGDEASSSEAALDLAETLLERDGIDAAVTALLDRATVWIVPFVNPDGFLEGTRYNGREVDLNRNYDVEWREGSYRSGDTPFSEPETAAVRVLAAYEPPLASLSLHSGATNIGYVWNYTKDPPVERDVLEAMANAYADRCTTEGFWITQGADWYITYGDTNDWSYGRLGGMDFTVELTDRKTPSEEWIPTFLDEHREALVGFLMLEPTVGGTVTDADSGLGIAATLWLERDGTAITAPFTSDPVGGGFFRIASEGEAVLHVEAPGFEPLEVEVDVGEPQALALALALQPADLVAALPSPRRVDGATVIQLPNAHSGEATLNRPGYPAVQVTVADGRLVADGAALAPGPWSVVLDDGRTWPNALVVSESSPEVREATREDEALVVRGSFAEGTRAFALRGTARALEPLPVLEEASDALRLDLAGLDPDETVDVLLVSDGRQEVVLDVLGEPQVDTGVSPDTGQGADTGPSEPVRSACGCASSPSPVFLLGLLPLLVGIRRRT